jgi:hypothetical protein
MRASLLFLPFSVSRVVATCGVVWAGVVAVTLTDRLDWSRRLSRQASVAHMTAFNSETLTQTQAKETSRRLDLERV